MKASIGLEGHRGGAEAMKVFRGGFVLYLLTGGVALKIRFVSIFLGSLATHGEDIRLWHSGGLKMRKV
jgi:hypothetical protein